MSRKIAARLGSSLKFYMRRAQPGDRQYSSAALAGSERSQVDDEACDEQHDRDADEQREEPDPLPIIDVRQ